MKLKGSTIELSVAKVHNNSDTFVFYGAKDVKRLKIVILFAAIAIYVPKLFNYIKQKVCKIYFQDIGCCLLFAEYKMFVLNFNTCFAVDEFVIFELQINQNACSSRTFLLIMVAN